MPFLQTMENIGYVSVLLKYYLYLLRILGLPSKLLTNEISYLTISDLLSYAFLIYLWYFPRYEFSNLKFKASFIHQIFDAENENLF